MKPLRLLLAVPLLAVMFALASQPAQKSDAAYVYEVYMYGNEVVPGVNTSIYGFLRFFFNDSLTEADVTVDVKGISNSGVTGADIRVGPPGTNGPIAIHLSDGDFIVTSTHIRLTPSDLQHMVNGDWYGVLYTTYHPNGEIRGQIKLPASAIGPAPAAPASPTTAPAPPPPAVVPTTAPAGGGIRPPNTGDAGLR